MAVGEAKKEKEKDRERQRERKEEMKREIRTHSAFSNIGMTGDKLTHPYNGCFSCLFLFP